MLEPANQNLAGRIPPAFHPWPDDEPPRFTRAVVLGVAIMALLVAAAGAAAIWL